MKEDIKKVMPEKVNIEFTLQELMALRVSVDFMKDQLEKKEDMNSDFKDLQKFVNQNHHKLHHQINGYAKFVTKAKKRKVFNHLMVQIMEEFDLLPIAKRWLEEGYKVNEESLDRDEFQSFVIEYSFSDYKDHLGQPIKNHVEVNNGK